MAEPAKDKDWARAARLAADRTDDAFIEALHSIWKRRDFINRNAPPCPNCRETMQIQIKNIAVPAEWRCRMCKHRFTHEPEADR